MKKLNYCLMIAAFVAGVFTYSGAQTRFGIKAGLNFANGPVSDDYKALFEDALGSDYNPGIRVAYHIGGQVEFGLSGNLGLSLGLQLSSKGTKYDLKGDFNGVPYTGSVTEKPMYLQVPVALTYRNNGFYAGVGPFIGFGIGGSLKVKATAQGNSDSSSQDINFGNSDTDDYAPLDYGAGLELGYETGRFRITGSYNLGLANVVPKDQVDLGGGDFKKKNSVIGLSLAYLFDLGAGKDK